MSRVLYRKYRSQSFDEVVGQNHVTGILKNAVINDSLAHAYLFVGSRGTGKTSMARILAKAINCQDLGKDGNPCNQCNNCKSITEGNFLDLIEIDAASNRGIDQIRELKERIEFSPSEGKYKVYIIDEVHMLTKEAFNALLKTLEEPPKHVIFMLATTDVHKLPPTILSRCQRYDLRLGSGDEILTVLKRASDAEGVKVSNEALSLLVESANGSYRDALSLLDVVVSGQLKGDNPAEVSEQEVRMILGIPDSTMVYYLLEKVVNHDVKSALKLIDELESKGINLQQFVKYVLVMLRDILVKTAIGELDPTVYGFAKNMNERQIIGLINGFLGVDRNLKNAHTPALILEVFVVELASSGNTAVGSQVGGAGGDSGNSSSPVGGSSKGVNAGATVGNSVSSKAGATNLTSDDAATKAIVEEVKGDYINVTALSENLDGSETVVVTNAEETELEKMIEEDEAKATSVVEADAIVDIKVEPIVEAETKSEVTTGNSSGEIPKNLTLKDIEANWDKVIAAAQKFNGHLYGFLKSSQLAEIKEDTLILHVPFEFHKERIEDPKTKPAVYQALAEGLGFSMPFKCEVNNAAKRKKKSSADLVLKSIQAAQDAIKASAENSKNEVKEPQQKPADNQQGGGATPRPISKKVEAIFDGM